MHQDELSYQLDSPTLRQLLDRGAEGYNDPYPPIAHDMVAWIEASGEEYELVLKFGRNQYRPASWFFNPHFVIGYDYSVEMEAIDLERSSWWYEVHFTTERGRVAYKLAHGDKGRF